MIIQDAIHFEQGSEEWHRARLGYVSASSISDVMSKGKGITRKNYLMRIVAERLTKQTGDKYSNASMEWGVNTEPLARMSYENTYDRFVDKTGFWKHPMIEWLGASPDGLVDTDGLIEIKCPNTTTHIEYLFENKVPNEYYKQIQCQLWVTGREWCDFISFDPRLPEKSQLFVIRTGRDEDLIKEMESEVVLFLDEVQQMIRKLV